MNPYPMGSFATGPAGPVPYPGGSAWPPAGPTGPAPPVRRPTPVVVAVGALILMAAGGLLYAIAALAVLPGSADRFRVAAAGAGFRPVDVDAMTTLLRMNLILAAVLGTGAALLLAALALGNLRGSGAARIATWVVSGLGVLFGCGSALVVLAQQTTPASFASEDQDFQELVGFLAEAYPDWWMPLAGGLAGAQTVGYLLVAVLLAVPSAGRHYRRVPGAATPAGYPQQWPTMPGSAGPSPVAPGSAGPSPGVPAGSTGPWPVTQLSDPQWSDPALWAGPPRPSPPTEPPRPAAATEPPRQPVEAGPPPAEAGPPRSTEVEPPQQPVEAEPHRRPGDPAPPAS
jgi:hypothetical protein